MMLKQAGLGPELSLSMELVALRYLRGVGRNGSAHTEKQLNKKR
jgi:hypothetical protein